MAHGAASQANVSPSKVESLDIWLPDIPTQNKIASILSTYDDLIENNLKRIKILEEMAQMIYREWFVNFRFPGHEKNKMVDSPLGKIPEGWEVKKLSELVSTQYGYTESASDEQVGPKFLRGTDINKTSYIDWSTVPYCPISPDKLSKYKLKKGDILVIRMADPGKVGIIEKDIKAVFASYLIRLEITYNKLAPYYLYHFLISDQYQGYITGASTGTTRKSASAGVVTGVNMVIPPKKPIEDFESIISSIREQINNLLDRNANLRKTRDLLLPKLISGELDVENLDIRVPEEAA
jgi:type I restriction enzyme S subunit